jgi:hypothetical protein
MGVSRRPSKLLPIENGTAMTAEKPRVTIIIIVHEFWSCMTSLRVAKVACGKKCHG